VSSPTPFLRRGATRTMRTAQHRSLIHFARSCCRPSLSLPLPLPSNSTRTRVSPNALRSPPLRNAPLAPVPWTGPAVVHATHATPGYTLRHHAPCPGAPVPTSSATATAPSHPTGAARRAAAGRMVPSAVWTECPGGRAASVRAVPAAVRTARSSTGRRASFHAVGAVPAAVRAEHSPTGTAAGRPVRSAPGSERAPLRA
jgi:hypothetical protein